MTSTASLEGVKKTVFFPFQGKNWGLKLLIGSALSLVNYIIPIVPMIPFYGYVGQIARHVIHNDEDPALPEWNDWGALFSGGIKVFGASIIFTLPGILVIIFGYMLMFAMNFVFLLDPRSYSSSQSIRPEFFAGSMVGIFAGILITFLGMLLLLLAGLFLPPAMGHLIAKGEFVAAFRVKEWWPIFKTNFSGYILAFLLMYGLNMALIGVVYLLYFTVVLCILMPFALMAATFIISSIHFSLIGVVYRDGVRKLAA